MIKVYWSPVINVQDNQEFVSELKYYEPETIYKEIKPREFFGLGAAGNVNVPGAKASKSMSANAKGHGAEKKGAGESGTNSKSTIGS